jgi:hypothetical protein
MARKVQGAEKSSGKNPRAPLVSHLEIFSKAVAEGHSHVEAAEICGRSRGSASSLAAYRRPTIFRLVVSDTSDRTDCVQTPNLARCFGKIEWQESKSATGVASRNLPPT